MTQYKGVPPYRETIEYVAKVQALYDRYRTAVTIRDEIAADGTLYYGAVGDSIKAFPIVNARIASSSSSPVILGMITSVMTADGRRTGSP